jgi:hypothetical protein
MDVIENEFGQEVYLHLPILKMESFGIEVVLEEKKIYQRIENILNHDYHGRMCEEEKRG